jgi:nitroimidazol reductase NimA-like FMN-containing flavoprotein (pyridoxamine 5'-phosphate oxidase superfamily)
MRGGAGWAGASWSGDDEQPTIQPKEATMSTPVIRTLERDESEAILARNHVGRLAYTREGRVDIEPIHYVFEGGWIYGRTSHGAKIEGTGEAWAPVAFEVDEVEEVFRWRSVVVHGGFYTVPKDGAEWERAEWSKGVDLLRRLIPGTLTGEDPVPGRTIIFRIAVQEISGREATPGASQ